MWGDAVSKAKSQGDVVYIDKEIKVYKEIGVLEEN